jgi:N-methylhydantoinase B
MRIRIPDDDLAPQAPVAIAVQAGRFRYPPQGIFGGINGSRARFLKNDLPADPSGLTLCNPGDTIDFQSAGGGGFGDPRERDVSSVERDVLYGYVSIEKAKSDYGVVIDAATLKADQAATRKLRAFKSDAQPS